MADSAETITSQADTIRLGISACLVGEKVRFDGGHKLDRFLVETLGQYVEYVPVCPEVEMGLPTPREALRLVEQDGETHLVFARSGEEVTGQMLAWARRRVEELAHENLCGFIFKSKSPSSGMERVKLYDRNGVPSPRGVGLFARVFMERFPLLPVEEEGRLHDPGLRENFIETIFTLRRWRTVCGEQLTAGALVSFHSRHKYLLLAHSPEKYREMGKLVARSGQEDPVELVEIYQQLLTAALRTRTTPRKHVNVLMHMLGYFKQQLSSDEKQEMLDLIRQYRDGQVPLVVPMTLMGHYVRKYRQPYLQQQIYLQPHPVELKLRNHA